MKLLLITKRYYMTKDIVLEGYGRQYELALRLAGAGWDIKAYCLDYRSKWGVQSIHAGGVSWRVYSALTFLPAWYKHITQIIRTWEPDVVVGCSDPLHITAAFMATKGSAARLVIDLHDNLDSMGMMRFPGFSNGVRSAINSADLVSCVSAPLKQKIASDCQPEGPVTILENAIPDIFEHSCLDKEESRCHFGFPHTEFVAGVAGSLYRNRGIETVLAGFELLQKEKPGLLLALAGPTDMPHEVFKKEGVHYFGNLDWKSVPSFMCAFDVGIVPNFRPLFADYCYPQKAVELCALSIPVVAADFGVMKTIAAGYDEILYKPDDPVDFARAVRCQLENRVELNLTVRNWAQQADEFNNSLMQILGREPHNDEGIPKSAQFDRTS